MNTSGLFCQFCGELNESDARFCKKCGAAQPQTVGTEGQAAAAQSAPQIPAGTAAPPPYAGTAGTPSGAAYVPPPGAGYVAPPMFGPPPPPYAVGFRGYGGFWIRFLAVIIDGLVLSIVIGPLMFIAMGPAIAAAMHSSRMRPGEPPDPASMMAFMSMVPLIILISVGTTWIYEAALTSSSKQATLGKMALGLKVVDKEGRRLTFLHATGRYFAKLLNRFTLYIGYIMAGFTERKQALHDMIAGTYVIKT